MTEKTIKPTKEKEINLYPNENPNAETAINTDEKHHKIARKKLGVCMDHSSAHLIGFTHNPTETTTIASDFTHQVKEQSLGRSENVMHHKEQQQQHHFYKKLGDAIKNYDEVLLFGPTNAKVELANILKSDHHFDKIVIDVKDADKMTAHQQHAFVNEHFSTY